MLLIEKIPSKYNKRNYKHGEYYTKLYKVWISMKQRCNNPKSKDSPDYGGRGITICPEWTDKLNGYINFRDWTLSNGYSKGLQINRIFNDNNYEPSNCNFVTAKENTRKRRGQKI